MLPTPPRLARSALAALAILAAAAVAAAQDAGAADAAETGAAEEPRASDPRIASLHALVAGTLDVAVDPTSLFDIDLANEGAVELEALRIRALLESIASPASPEPEAEPAPEPRAGRARSKASKTSKPTPAEPSPPPPSALRSALAAIDPALLEARLELDRARLAFYELAPARRAALLQDHAARQEAEKPRPPEPRRPASGAEVERQRALEAARLARGEAERVVRVELARLIAIEEQVETARATFRDAQATLAARRDALLGWHRRIRDAKAATTREADATYDAIRRTLRASHDDLSHALDELGARGSSVPELGPDALLEVPANVPTDEARARREAVGARIAEARREEAALREQRAAELLDEIDTLNRERLDLLPYLSADKRDAITGFTGAGWDQARSEARHLSLILRYHHYASTSWLAALRRDGPSGASAWSMLAVAVPWSLMALVFAWGRRRVPVVLDAAEARVAEQDRIERRTFPSPRQRTVRFAKKIHRPLEWVLFFLASLWLLPASFRALLEVQLVASAIAWFLSGSLVVTVINAFADGSHARPSADRAADTLRLRSLRLVGRTVVVFALTLVITTRLVGQGTIYSWVISTCWFAVLPVFLVLVRWWRGIVFRRMERTRKKTSFEQWVLSNQRGWKSFAAAMIGVVWLFGLGTLKTVRSWISSFDLARRVHAYLFKRELERLGEGGTTARMRPLHASALEALHPERAPDRWLSCPADEVLQAIAARVEQRQGGVVALVGALGMGKSSLLRALSERVAGTVRATCSMATAAAEVRAICGTPPRLVLLDDAQTLVKPIIGGLELFDDVIARARAHCEHTTWVLAIDASVWPFLKRARDARPLFDETYVLRPWDETQIGTLLAERNAVAGINPGYEQLIDTLPPSADEIDRFDALRDKQAGYERMLWDHVRGNPALALEAWRVSLVENEAGAVYVRPLQLPDSSRLNVLPDSSLFILRAVLQLTPARVEDVALATRLSPEQVLTAFRFGQTQGILMEHDGCVRVTWPWLRAVTRLLERRHLLVNP